MAPKFAFDKGYYDRFYGDRSTRVITTRAAN